MDKALLRFLAPSSDDERILISMVTGKVVSAVCGMSGRRECPFLGSLTASRH